jgi:hypothetical protein
MKMKPSQRSLLFLASLIAVIASGCIELPNQTILYKDSDVEVIRHGPLVIMADGGPSSFELIALGHSYILSDSIDHFNDGCNGFAKTSDGSAIVFIAESQKRPQPGMLTGVVHVIDSKSKSDIAVPLAIKWGGLPCHFFVKSYDGKKIVLAMDSNYHVDSNMMLEIDLDTKQVTKIDHTNNSVHK